MLNYTELKEYPNYFICSDPPSLRRSIKGKTYDCQQTQNSNKDNYWTVTLKTTEGKYVKRFMHRLLMQTFVPNPENKAHVNHIDGDKSNNELSNLEWATPIENAQHAVTTGLLNCGIFRDVPIFQYNLSGKFIAGFANHTEAQKITGIPKQNISKASTGKRVHAGYFQWRKYKKDQIETITKKYIKGYKVKNKYFESLKELANLLHYKQPDKASLSLLQSIIKKRYSTQIEKVYYE